MNNTDTGNKAVVRWLTVVCLLILIMIGVGGVTRLTDSGLSMVEWQPILGAMPPLSEEGWIERFESYKQHPQFRLHSPDMSLDAFKGIFFWEYLHRLLGRGIGVVYFFPFLYFAVRRRLSLMLFFKLLLGFVVGGLQGVLGWYMVKSGLIDNPYVSHYRLAAHFLVALFLLGYLLWILLTLRGPRLPVQEDTARPPRKSSLLFMILVVVQCTYGAFVAGLDAGKAFNTFPKMMGEWLPLGWDILEPFWRNFFDNVTLVQFMHRTLGWTLLLSALLIWLRNIGRKLDVRSRFGVNLIGGLTAVQFFLGILTLIYAVPVVLGAMHQVLASILFCAAVYLVHAAFHHEAA